MFELSGCILSNEITPTFVISLSPKLISPAKSALLSELSLRAYSVESAEVSLSAPTEKSNAPHAPSSCLILHLRDAAVDE